MFRTTPAKIQRIFATTPREGMMEAVMTKYKSADQP